MGGNDKTIRGRGRPRGRPAAAAQTRRSSARIASLGNVKNSNRRTRSSRLQLDVASINKPSNPRVQQLQRQQMMRMTMPMQQITTKKQGKGRGKKGSSTHQPPSPGGAIMKPAASGGFKRQPPPSGGSPLQPSLHWQHRRKGFVRDRRWVKIDGTANAA